jgi:hypothetical protein
VNRTLRIVGLTLVIVGTIWLLQGIGVLPGSFMWSDPVGSLRRHCGGSGYLDIGGAAERVERSGTTD